MRGLLRHSFFGELLALLAINSQTGNTKGADECFERISNKATEFGFLSKRAAGGKVLEIYPRELDGIPKIGFLVHIDTVPVGEGWKHSPYGQISRGEDGKIAIYGRGVLDDKAAALMTLYALHSTRDRIKPSWKIIIGSYEETDMSDMKEYLAEGNILPSFIVNIDGDGIQNGCRGSAIVEMTFERKSTQSVLEELYSIGEAANTLPREVRIRYKGKGIKTMKGQATHSSLPGGENAILRAAKLVPYGEFLGFIKFIRDLNQGNAFFIEDGESHLEEMDDIKTQAIPTQVKLEDDKIILTVNLRISPKIVSEDLIIQGLNKTRETYDCGVELKSIIMPSYTNPDHEEFGYMLEAYKRTRNISPKITVARGTGYGGVLNTPGAIFGPRFSEEDVQSADTCHMVDENWSLKEMVGFYQLLKEYILISLTK